MVRRSRLRLLALSNFENQPAILRVVRKLLTLLPLGLVFLSHGCFGPPMPLCDGAECRPPVELDHDAIQRLLRDMGQAREKGEFDRLRGFVRYARETPPGTPLRAASEYSLAVLLMREGQWTEASGLIEPGVRSEGLLKDYFLLAFGVSHEALDQLDEAEGAYRRLLLADPDSTWVEEARSRLARLYWEQGRWQEILVLSDHLPAAQGDGDLLQRYRLSDRKALRPLAWYRIGALERLGHQDAALELLKTRFARHPDEKFDPADGLPATAEEGLRNGQERPLVEFIEAGLWVERSRALKRLNRNVEAAQELNQVLQGRRGNWLPEGKRLVEEYGDSHLRTKNYSVMEQELTQLVSQLHDQPALRAQAEYWKGRALARQGRYNEALAIYKRAVKAGGAAEKARVEYFAGLALEEMGNSEQAARRFQQVLRYVETGNYAEEALWRLGFEDYRKGRFREARQWFQKLSDIPPASSLDYWRARYFLARSLEETDSGKAAVKMYWDILDQSPPSVYGFWAARRLGLDTGRACQWLPRSCASKSVPDSMDREPRPVEILTEEENGRVGRQVRKAELLFMIGMHEAAERELNQLDASALSETLRMDLSRLLGREGRFHEAQRIIRYNADGRLWRAMEEGTLDTWRLAYWPGYQYLVREESIRHALPPGLVHGLIQEESRYQPAVASPAGAQGLMQLMPATAAQIRSESGFPEPELEELHDPAVNIGMGVGYLRSMTDRLGGRHLLALAAYNAGPGAVERWMGQKHDESCEIFLEDIPYAETRGYVKKVTGSALVYDLLYGLDSGSSAWPEPQDTLCLPSAASN